MKQHVDSIRQSKLSSVYVFLVFIGCLSISSCNKTPEEIAVKSMNEDETEVRLGASINLRTRATDNGFDQQDSIGLYLSKRPNEELPESLLPSGNYADNILYELTEKPDSWTPEKKSYYPVDGSLLDFYAYYPYRQPAFTDGTKLNLEIAPDQSNYIDYTRSDFMLAKTTGVERKAEKVHLDFYHRLSQITFTLKAGVGVKLEELKEADISIINAISEGTFDLQTDSIPQAGTTRNDILPYGSWSDTTATTLAGKVAILMPQEINTTTYLQVTVGSRIYTYRPNTPNLLESGCSQEFIITVNHSDLDIETQIHPWSTKPAIEGNAEEETEEPESDALVTMTTLTTDTISMQIIHQGNLIVDWGDKQIDTNVFFHIYKDQAASHDIKLKGENTELISFTCREAKLTKIDVSKNKTLKALFCDANLLTTLDVTQNTDLDSLGCGINLLKYLDVAQNTHLKFLAIGINQITSIDLTKNTSLETLYCSSNSITSLEFSGNPSIKSVGCEDNPLSTDNDKILIMINSFPNRTDQEAGYLYININPIPQEVQTTCASKNWNIV